MTSKREELIEEAAKAIYEAAPHSSGFQWQYCDQDKWRARATAALAVFEKSVTPTNDEREAQGWREAEAYADDHEPSKRAETAEDFMAGWRTADRTRRPVQGEPTDSWAGRARRSEAALLRVRDIHIATMEALSETFSAVAVTEQGENR